MSRKKTGRGKVIAGRRNTMIGDGRFVSFYCRGTIESPHDKWRIGSVRRDVHNGVPYWTESTAGYVEAGETLFYGLPPFTRWLDGSRYIPQDLTLGGAADEADVYAYSRAEFRTIWELECRTCRFKRPIRPAAALPILDRISASGVLEVPIREFSRRVESTQSSQ